MLLVRRIEGKANAAAGVVQQYCVDSELARLGTRHIHASVTQPSVHMSTSISAETCWLSYRVLAHALPHAEHSLLSAAHVPHVQ